MKKTTALIYSIFAGIIYLFAILFLGINIYNEFSHGEIRTQRRWDNVTNSIQQATIKINPASAGYNKEVERIIGNFDDFAMFEITLNGEKIYSYYANKETQQVPESKLIKKHYRAFSIKGDNIYVTGAMYILRPTSIVSNTKISFLIVLITTLITIFLIILLTMKAKKSEVDVEIENEDLVNDNEEDSEDDDIINTIDYKSSTVDFSELNNEIENSEIKEEFDESEVFEESEPDLENEDSKETSINDLSANVNDSAEVSDDEIQEDNLEDDNDATVEEKIELPVEDSKPVEIEEKEENPKGLFNAETGLGWESYFIPRLENELNRAISSEIDLSLFIFNFPGLERNNDVFAKICQLLEAQFQFKDLLFEYKEDSIAALKIDMTIDEALIFADKLSEEINAITENKFQHFIGISAKSIRMITADRLLTEANEAMEHAKKDTESCVIAFRADVTKYRKFIENQ